MPAIKLVLSDLPRINTTDHVGQKAHRKRHYVFNIKFWLLARLVNMAIYVLYLPCRSHVNLSKVIQFSDRIAPHRLPAFLQISRTHFNVFILYQTC
jgi:hypothetical protein